MLVVGSKTQMIDPVRVLLISSEDVLILRLEQLYSAIVFTDQEKVTVLSELNGSCHVFELEKLACWFDLLLVFTFWLH